MVTSENPSGSTAKEDVVHAGIQKKQQSDQIGSDNHSTGRQNTVVFTHDSPVEMPIGLTEVHGQSNGQTREIQASVMNNTALSYETIDHNAGSTVVRYSAIANWMSVNRSRNEDRNVKLWRRLFDQLFRMPDRDRRLPAMLYDMKQRAQVIEAQNAHVNRAVVSLEEGTAAASLTGPQTNKRTEYQTQGMSHFHGSPFA